MPLDVMVENDGVVEHWKTTDAAAVPGVTWTLKEPDVALEDVTAREPTVGGVNPTGRVVKDSTAPHPLPATLWAHTR